ncbi:site-specific integrase [Flavobacterium amnicola]|uniref:Site-specific integrase n=1 Tax=Flavobacterium amnicola TaxID=2506422 RepID=A0A4Q1K012_9FLAO|nr:site-specific integrase [Flavobacterium amnicola]
MKKIKVTLRKKAISNGRQSLYLDFYPPIINPQTGNETRREFLKMYILTKTRNPIEKQQNDEIISIAESIKNKRQNELSKENIYSEFEKQLLKINEIGEQSFVGYFKKEAEKRTGKNYDIWNIAIEHFTDFLQRENLKFSEVTISLINDYKHYLLKAKSKRKSIDQISTNTALSYFNKIKATLKNAYKEGKLRTDINSAVGSIKEQETRRDFLTLEEAKKLAKTDCNNDLVKRASLFSILTGLRYSDIEKLQWSEIEKIKNNHYIIRFKQKKTKNQETIPIIESTFHLLGERKNDDVKIFDGLKKWDIDRTLPNWIKSAGISKHITFHCFRHTYATLQLSKNTNIYTVSGMLGHRGLKATQVYTNLIDNAKLEAAHKIDLDL